MAREETVLNPKTEHEELLTTKTLLEQALVQNAKLEKQVQWLMERMRLMRQKQFGSSSEKSAYYQLNFFNEAEATADERVPEPEMTQVREHCRKKVSESQEALPSDLPEEIVEHTLPETKCKCPECGGLLHVMGKEKRRELKLILAKAVVVQHIRCVYSCRGCERDACEVPMLKAPVDEPVLKGSIASTEAVAHIMTQKYVMGVLLYRQEQEYGRKESACHGKTMSNWVVKSAEQWLSPVHDWQNDPYKDAACLMVMHSPPRVL